MRCLVQMDTFPSEYNFAIACWRIDEMGEEEKGKATHQYLCVGLYS